jgi:hypothetical protein
MSIVVLIALVPVGLFVALIPALAVQFALHYWYRPAVRVSLDEAWGVGFEERVRELSAAVASSEPLHD